MRIADEDDAVGSCFTRPPFSLSTTGSFWFSSDGRYSPTVLERDPDREDSDDLPDEGLFFPPILFLYLASCSMKASIVDAGWNSPSAAALRLNSLKIGLVRAVRETLTLTSVDFSAQEASTYVLLE